MKITFLYNSYGDNGLGPKSRAFTCIDERSILEMVLWLTAAEFLPGRPVSRKVHEVIVNQQHFKTDAHLNPSDWMAEIKKAIKVDEIRESKRKADAYDRIKANNAAAGKASASKLTPEQLSARGKKAVQARIAKYGQKSKKP